MNGLRSLLLDSPPRAAVDLVAFAAVVLVAIYLTEGDWRVGTALGSGMFFAALCAITDLACGRR